jgi:hypothetical protein
MRAALEGEDASSLRMRASLEGEEVLQGPEIGRGVLARSSACLYSQVRRRGGDCIDVSINERFGSE